MKFPAVLYNNNSQRKIVLSLFTTMMMTRSQTNLVNQNQANVITCFPLAIELTIRFLTCHDLFNFMFSAKASYQCISRRAIVECVMHNGNENQRRTIEELFTLTSCGSIYDPSSARLMRLVCARICEICLTRKISHVRTGFGLAACWECTRTSSCYVATNTPNERRSRLELDEILRHPRIANKIHRRRYPNANQTSFTHSWSHIVWSGNHVNMSCVFVTDGVERVGPIATLRDIQTMSTFNRQEEMDAYINNGLSASPIENYSDFNDAVRENRYQSFSIVQARKLAKKEGALEPRRKRIESVKRIVLQVTPLLNADVRQSLMVYHVDNKYLEYKRIKHRRCIFFRDPRVDQVMIEYVRYPSKMKTNRQIKELADRLNAL